MLLMSTSGCRTPSPVHSERLLHDTLYQALEKYDSIYIHESSAERYHPSSFHYDSLVQIYYRVDTLTKESAKTEYCYRLLHDTTYVHRTDTVVRVIRTENPHRIRGAPVMVLIMSIGLWLLLLVLGKRVLTSCLSS